MKSQLRYHLLFFIWGLGFIALAEETLENAVTEEPSRENAEFIDLSPSPTPSPTTEESAFPNERSQSKDVTRFNAMTDWQYASNGPVQQGFSLPHLWIGAGGQLTDNLEYRFSACEARETLSIQLPFLVPREVSLRIRNLGDGATRLKVGLFRPWLDPVWSNMLTDMPEYLATHSLILLPEQLGMEAIYSGAVETGVGMVNGNGLYALNTNNARAFYLFIRNAEAMPLRWGASSYSFRQSVPGGANFRDNWVVHGFLSWKSEHLGIQLGGEVSWGDFVDVNSQYFIRGWAGFLTLPFLGGDFLLRAESLKNVPAYSGGALKQFQLGPVFSPTPGMKLFLMEQYTEPGLTAGDVTTFLRLRVELN